MTGSNPTPEAQPSTPAPGGIPPYATPPAPQDYAKYSAPQTGYAQQPQTAAYTPYSMPLTDAYQQNIIAAQYQPQRWNGMAIAGFVCSFFISIVGLILSIIGLKQIKERNEKGHGLALAGVIISRQPRRLRGRQRLQLHRQRLRQQQRILGRLHDRFGFGGGHRRL